MSQAERTYNIMSTKDSGTLAVTQELRPEIRRPSGGNIPLRRQPPAPQTPPAHGTALARFPHKLSTCKVVRPVARCEHMWRVVVLACESKQQR